MNIFITGIAGMIGFHTTKHLVSMGHRVTGVDNFNDYYEVSLKRERARILKDEYAVTVTNGDILDLDYSVALKDVDIVLHLAAYANPRHSLEFPQLYIDNNITGSQRLIEGVERAGIKNVVYASSSCVMHEQPLPWSEKDHPGHQNNPYGWTKRANECQFIHSKIAKTVGLRFFTVYGPYGRPDMALFGFTKNIIEGKAIDLFNYGDMARDFTFVEDIVQGITLVIDDCYKQEESSHEIYNIGYGQQVKLVDFVEEIERCVGAKAVTNLLPKHPADVPATWADTTKIQGLGYRATTSITDGVGRFVDWYRNYYKV
jgi:UDP-glucuronate 4-epimerase